MCCAIGAILLGLAAGWRTLALRASALRWAAAGGGVLLLAASAAAVAAGPARLPLAALHQSLCRL